MRRSLLVLLAGMLILGSAGMASAGYVDWNWVDKDMFSNPIKISDGTSNGRVNYDGLNIAAEDGFRPGVDQVTWAKLFFWLKDDDCDDIYEYAQVWSRGGVWESVGEVDGKERFGPFWAADAGILQLNRFGFIDVGVRSEGYRHDGERVFGDFLWLGAKVSAHGLREMPEPVPEPATMFLLGSGLVGLAGYGRKKFKK